MVVATLTFIKPLERYEDEKPYFLNINENSSAQILQSNLEYSPYDEININSIREEGLQKFSLKENGFQVFEHETSLLESLEESNVQAYIEEIAAMVTKECKSVHTLCYDYRIRKNDREVIDYEKDQDQGRSKTAPPVYPAHVDHKVEGGPKRIRRHLTEEEASVYLSGKYRSRIININPCDLVSADRVTPDFRVELYYLRHNPSQKWYWMPDQEPNETKTSPKRQAPSKKFVLDLLGFVSKALLIDIEKCMHLQHELGPSSKYLATYIIHSKQMKRWITKSAHSSCLLVNANRISAAMDDISAVSVLFCGLYAEIDAEDTWVTDMVRSLIGQLLAKNKGHDVKFDLPFLHENDVRRIRRGSPTTLCEVFCQLIEQIPPNRIVICILDSVSRYEASSVAERDMIRALRCLTNICHRKTRAVVKILLTCPSNSSFAGLADDEYSVEVDDVLEVPEYVDGARQGVFNAEGVGDDLGI